MVNDTTKWGCSAILEITSEAPLFPDSSGDAEDRILWLESSSRAACSAINWRLEHTEVTMIRMRIALRRKLMSQLTVSAEARICLRPYLFILRGI